MNPSRGFLLDRCCERAERPYGASLWERWPEFGYYLDNNVDNTSAFRSWRVPRAERAWPKLLTRGGEWPWEAVDAVAAAHAAHAADAEVDEAIIDVLAQSPDLSGREVRERLQALHDIGRRRADRSLARLIDEGKVIKKQPLYKGAPALHRLPDDLTSMNAPSDNQP